MHKGHPCSRLSEARVASMSRAPRGELCLEGGTSMSRILSRPPGRILPALGVLLVLGGFAWTAAAQDKANQQSGAGAQRAPANSSQPSADTKSKDSPRENNANKES